MEKLWHFKYKTPPPTLAVLYQGTRVAELQKWSQGFVFRYLPAFRELCLLPFPGLAPRMGDIPFEELPAFFQERLPDLRRPEIQQKMRALGIDQRDKLKLLAELGSHAVTDPFELRLVPAA